MSFEVLPSRLDGPIHLQPTVYRDGRGFFVESFREDLLRDHGIDEVFVQDNHSRSAQGVIRGIHVTVGAGMSKLVRCARGSITDVVVDLRPDSPAFGEWEAFELDDLELRLLYVPIGFGHGFCVTSEEADVIYRCSATYDPVSERALAWDDAEVGIEWPASVSPVVSERDSAAASLADLRDELRFDAG